MHRLTWGQSLSLAAEQAVNYQLFDTELGQGSQKILTKRVGNNLEVFLSEQSTQAELVLTDYYQGTATHSSMLVGKTVDGEFYSYVPVSTQANDAIPQLAESVLAAQVLGGEKLSSGFWAFNPWWATGFAALSAVGAIVAAS